MARPRTPTNVLAMKGAFKKNPNRTRTDPLTPGPIGRAPAWLSDDEKKIWREVVRIAPAGVLTRSDRIALEELVSLIHERRTCLADMSGAKRQLLRTYLGAFGLTAADRARINVSPPRKPNRFAEFTGG